MATIPVSGTDIRLLSGIPFSNDYKHTRYFNNVTDQTTYFSSKGVVHRISQANFQRIEGKTFIAVNKSIDQLHKTNYIMFRNAEYNNKWFYAFVTKLEYIQKNTTYVHFELDVYQTWRYDISIKPSFVVREHCKLWESNGNPVRNTVPENLDYGSELSNVKVKQYKPMGDYKWYVIVTKTPIHSTELKGEPHPKRIGIMQPLTYYILPYNVRTGSMPLFRTNNDKSVGLLSIDKALKAIYESEDAVNNVVSIYTTENIGVRTLLDKEGSVDRITVYDATINRVDIEGKKPAHLLYVVGIDKFVPDIRTLENNKYDGFKNVKESKLLLSPYTSLTLCDYKGNAIDLKVEYIRGNSIEIINRGSLGTSNKVSYGIRNYNRTSNVDPVNADFISLEHSIINMNPNDIPVITDHLASFLQGNRNSIQNQKNVIDHNKNMSQVTANINTVSSGASAMQGNMGSLAGVAGSQVAKYKGQKDSVLAMQGIMAKQKDLDNIPPQIAKMGSNTSFDIGHQYTGLFIIKKQITNEYINKLEGFFNMYGYKVNEVKIPNIKTRRYWNYVQTENCIIRGYINNEDLQEIKDIFDNGITFWHTDDIGNYDLNNYVL